MMGFSGGMAHIARHFKLLRIGMSGNKKRLSDETYGLIDKFWYILNRQEVHNHKGHKN